MDIELKVKWIYTKFKKGFHTSDWDIIVEEISNGSDFSSDYEYPLFIFPNMIDDIESLKEFIVLESNDKRIWFHRNDHDRISGVCNLEKGKLIEIDENKLLEIYSEITGVINHITNSDFGLAKCRAEIIKEKIDKLI